MTSQSIKVNSQQMNKMHQYYQNYLIKPVPYSEFRAKVNGITITAYTSGKVLFQGGSINSELAKWTDTNQITANSKKDGAAKSTPSSSLPKGFSNWTVIGSDEVGNGSYFGALTVCSVYLAQDKMELIKELGVKDSKQLNDQQIRELAWQIKATVPYHLTIYPPDKYNQVIGSQYNATSIKVSLHNSTLYQLIHKLNDVERQQLEGILIDQFTSETNYRKYLKTEADPVTNKLYFAKQGESKHLAVACASIIAREAFLTSLEELGRPYNTILPSGAGANVDLIAARLIKKYGRNILKNTAKLHFKNTEKALKIAYK